MKEEWKPKISNDAANDLANKAKNNFLLTGKGGGFDDERVMPKKMEVGGKDESEEKKPGYDESYNEALIAKELSMKHREDAIKRILSKQGTIETLKYSVEASKLKKIKNLQEEINKLDSHIKTVENDIMYTPKTLANKQQIKSDNEFLDGLIQIRKSKLEEIDNLESFFNRPSLN